MPYIIHRESRAYVNNFITFRYNVTGVLCALYIYFNAEADSVLHINKYAYHNCATRRDKHMQYVCLIIYTIFNHFRYINIITNRKKKLIIFTIF